MHRVPLWDEFRADLRYALRLFVRTPTLSLAAVASLALGIGANTALFSVLDAVVWRTLPVQEPERLVQLRIGHGDRVSGPLWQFLRDQQGTLEGVLCWANARFNVGAATDGDFLPGQFVSGSYFSVLGVRPVVGRLFDGTDDRPGGDSAGPVAVISAGLWQRRYGSAPRAVGQTLTIDGQPFTIIGVAPATFSGLDVGRPTDVFLPLESEPLVHVKDSYLNDWHSGWLSAMGRLRAGDSAEHAQADLQRLLPAVRDILPQAWSPRERASYARGTIELVPASRGLSWIRVGYGPALFLLFPVVAAVLLIACANVANLLLARAEARRHEFAVRLAIGASRARVLRQLLTESALLAGVGAGAGLLVAQGSARVLVSQLSTSALPVSLGLDPSPRMLLFTAGVSLMTVILFGLAPALRASGTTPLIGLTRRAQGAGRGARGLVNGLVIAQLALSLVLIVGAALFLRSFVGLLTHDVGFARGTVLVVNADVRRGSATEEGRRALYDELLQMVRAIPDVRSAALAINTPASGWMWNSGDTFMNAISAGYFATLHTPLLAGRDFDAHDTAHAAPVVIVNQAFVRKLLHGGTGVGEDVIVDADSKVPLKIVGVVADAIYRRPQDQPPPTAFLPIAQARSRPAISLVIEARGDEGQVIFAIRHAIGSAHPTIALDVRTLAGQFSDAVVRERLLASVSTFFGALGVILAAVGLYGIMSYTIARRRRELGIRLALGATSARLKRLVLGDVALILSLGVLLGLACCAALARYIASLLVDLTPTDPASWAVATITLIAVTLIAGYVPARRAARVNPAAALRDEP